VVELLTTVFGIVIEPDADGLGAIATVEPVKILYVILLSTNDGPGTTIVISG
jgi:hypothetical protein